MGWFSFLDRLNPLRRKLPHEEFLGLCNDVKKGSEDSLALVQIMLHYTAHAIDKSSSYSGFFSDRTRMDNFMADMVRKAYRMENIKDAALERIKAGDHQSFSVNFQGLQACIQSVSSHLQNVTRLQNPSIHLLGNALPHLREMDSSTDKKDLPTLQWHATNLANTIISSQQGRQAT